MYILLKWWILIDFKQLPRLLKFIGLLKFETCVYCSVHIFDKPIFYCFHCDLYFLLSDKTTFNKGCLPNNLFCHIMLRLKDPHPVAPSNTQNNFLKRIIEYPVEDVTQCHYSNPLAKAYDIGELLLSSNFFPSPFPVSATYSNSSFLKTWPRNCNCRHRIAWIRHHSHYTGFITYRITSYIR